MADLSVLTGKDFYEAWIFFHFQNNLALTGKGKEVNRTEHSLDKEGKTLFAEES